MIYMDNNATSRIDDDVLAEMEPYLRDEYGNPSAVYAFGSRVRPRLDEARQRVAMLIGAQPQEVIFTSCGTESDNTAIQSAVDVMPSRRHIITSRVEHLAVLEPCRRLRAAGYRVTEIDVDGEGRLDIEQYSEALDEDTALVSFVWANNETGVIFPITKLAEMAKSVGALFHTDAVQAVGKVPMELGNSSVDMLSLSGHKLHGPKGIGALYVRRETPYSPFIAGGHQERNRRAGTENTAAIVGLGKACELAAANLSVENERVRRLRDRMQEALVGRIPANRVNGGLNLRLPNTLSIAFKHAEEDALLGALSDEGICASSGSACNSETLDSSHVMLAMGVPAEYLNGVLRLSLSRFTTDDEVDEVVEKLPRIVEQVRSSSILGQELVSNSRS